MRFLSMMSPSISLPSSHCLSPIACKSTWSSTAEIYLSGSRSLLAWWENGLNAFQVSICFVKSQDETKVITDPKMKR